MPLWFAHIRCADSYKHIFHVGEQQQQEHNKQLLRINIRSADNTVVRLEEHVAETEEIRNRTLSCKGWRVEAGHLGASRTYKNPAFVMLRTLWCVYRICLICYSSSLLCKVEILVGYYVCIRLTFHPVMAVGYFWDGCLHSLILESLQVSLEDWKHSSSLKWWCYHWREFQM